MRAVIDTSILVDFLRGHYQARMELALYRSPAISVISWMEVMAATTPETESAARAFLQSFDLLEIDARTADAAVRLQRSKAIKLPDAIVWATAQANQCLLVTRNARDFDQSEPGIRIPYTL